MPAFLTIDHSLDVRDGAGIVEDPRGNLERDAMLSPVNPILLRIPNENHCICNTVSQSGAGPQHTAALRPFSPYLPALT
jgi:hypothetical protein